MKVTQDNIGELTPYVMEVLDGWQRSAEQSLQLLGLTDKASPRDLRKFRAKAAPLPFSEELAERIEHIAGILDALRTSYPFGGEYRARWLYQNHRRFNQQPPLKIMLTEGLSGLIRVRTELDCAFGWQNMES